MISIGNIYGYPNTPKVTNVMIMILAMPDKIMYSPFIENKKYHYKFVKYIKNQNYTI